MSQVRRRHLLVAAGAVCLSVILPALAQQEKPRRIAWFGPGRADLPSPYLAALVSGLRELGWEEGRNISIIPHWTEGGPEDELRLARLMLASNPELIVVRGRNVIALHRARPAVPVVFAFSGNPVDAGLVQSFARPGGNMTGISMMSLDLVGKRVELLKEIMPHARRLGILARPEHAGEHRERAASEEAARRVGLTTAYAPVRSPADLDEAFRTLVQERCDSLVVFPDTTMSENAARIARLAIERRMAAVSGASQYPDTGFLFSYGPDGYYAHKALARYADRILRGAKPEELPVELPKTVEFAINLKTAKTLGIRVPQSIVLRADRVIE